MSENWHVYPSDDLIDHDTETDDCICIPDAKFYGGACIMVHHSLDGRELEE